MNKLNDSDPQDNLNRVFEKIQEVAAKSKEGDFIYPGEPQHYEEVSSSLWRECEKVF